MVILGIETSCDETSTAIVNNKKEIISNIIYSQIDRHKPYGGVVPELAARDHLKVLPDLIIRSCSEALMSIHSLDAVAATGGPGLIGGIIIGTTLAKTIASSIKKPFIAINHLEGHALTARLTNSVGFPYILLLVSGGHTQYLIVNDVGRYKNIGITLDDAVGEVFDKVGKMLGLDYPGGPHIERSALYGDYKRFSFPKPLIKNKGFNLSFSGLKTSVALKIRKIFEEGSISENDKSDIAASFQYTIIECLIDKTRKIFEEYPNINTFVISGGVASNRILRNSLNKLCVSYNKEFIAPPIELCTDNAAMIAWSGIERLRIGLSTNIDFSPNPNWALT